MIGRGGGGREMEEQRRVMSDWEGEEVSDRRR